MSLLLSEVAIVKKFSADLKSDTSPTLSSYVLLEEKHTHIHTHMYIPKL